MNNTSHEDERRIAMSGVVYTGVGRGVSMVLEAIVAIAMPAVLGTQDYGSWVVFRSVMIMMLGVAVFGQGVTMVHYVSMLVAGRRDDAKRLFKALLAFRFGLAVLAGFFGFVLFAKGGDGVFGPRAPILLSCCIFLRVFGSAMLGLLYGERQFRKTAITMIFQHSGTPFVVLIGYLLGGYAWVPGSCLFGEFLYFLLILVLSRPYLGWVRGWPAIDELKTILGFTWNVSISQVFQMMFVQSIPYVMKQLRMTLDQIAFVGLGLRLAQLVFSVLKQVSGSLAPSLRVALETRGLEQVVVWKSFTCRVGLVLCFVSVGGFAFVGRYVVPFLWGSEYADASLIILVALLGVVPRWIATEVGSLLQVIEKPGLFVVSVVCMIVSFFGLLYVLPPIAQGLHLLGLLMIAFMVFMMSSLFVMKRWVGVLLSLKGVLPLLVVVVVALLLGDRVDGVVMSAVSLMVWLVLYVGFVFRGGCLKWGEVLQVAGYFWPGNKSAGGSVL